MIQNILNWFVGTANAAAEPLLVNASGELATAAEENVLGTILSSTVLGALAVIMVVFLVITVMPRILRRYAR